MQTSEVINKANETFNKMGSPRTEGRFTKTVEEQTAKIPSIAFLTLGVGSILASAGLRAMGQKTLANFVGLWTPTILIMGLYNKIVKVEGSERHSV